MHVLTNNVKGPSHQKLIFLEYIVQLLIKNYIVANGAAPLLTICWSKTQAQLLHCLLSVFIYYQLEIGTCKDICVVLTCHIHVRGHVLYHFTFFVNILSVFGNKLVVVVCR